MSQSLEKEYITLLTRKHLLEKELSSLPIGNSTENTIKGKQRTIEKREILSSELIDISTCLLQLEQEAKTKDNNVFCRLMVHKMCMGMDELSLEDKSRCISFGDAMSSIEGVPISEQTQNDLNSWKNGKMKYISVFEKTLKRYGFPV